jgi:hypothetical protein
MICTFSLLDCNSTASALCHLGDSIISIPWWENLKKRKRKGKTPIPNAANYSSKAKMEMNKQQPCGVASRYRLA